MTDKFYNIVVTVGTSIFQNLDLYGPEKEDKKYDYKSVQLETTAKDKFRNATEEKKKKFSAEVNSIEKILEQKKISNYRLIFLVSDTFYGRLAGEILKEAYREKTSKIEVGKLEGLTNKFINLENIFKKLNNIYERYSENFIFNITGGFKSLIPYITFFALTKYIPLMYIYESSNRLIEIPPVPALEFNLELFYKIEEKFKKLSENLTMPKNEFFDGIDYYERKKYEYLLDDDENGKVILSYIGEYIWNLYKKKYPVELRKTDISPEQKKISIPQHHGNEKLQALWNKLKKFPYIEEGKGIDYGGEKKNKVECIKEYDNYYVICCLLNTDPKYRLKVKTTASTEEENQKIADLIKKRYL